MSATIYSAPRFPSVTLVLLLFTLDPDVSAYRWRNEHPPPTAMIDAYYFKEHTQALECTHVVDKCNLLLAY